MDSIVRWLKQELLAYIDPGVPDDDYEHMVSVSHCNILRWFDALDRLSAEQREPVVRVKESDARRWRHKKRGTTYTEIGRGYAQVAVSPIKEMSAVVIYQSDDDGTLWVRNAIEFDDGRFEAIASTAIEITSSDGGVEGHAPEGSASVAVRGLRERRPRDMEAAGSQREAETGRSPEVVRVREQASNCVSQDSDRIAGPAAARGRAGIKPGPSEAIADVSVDELARLIERAVIDDCKTKPGSAWFDGLAAAARAVFARFRIERLDRLASGRR